MLILKMMLLLGNLSFASASPVQVNITWSYQNFPSHIELYEPIDSYSGKFVAQTKVIDKLSEAPLGKKITGPLSVKLKSSTSAILVVENKTDEELYFFAVPHVLNPHHASAGHYFECLCNSKVYRVPPGKFWYRIVRVNLNSSFQKIKAFEINHQIVGIAKSQALGEYKDQLYEK